MVKALPFIHQPDRVARKASYVSAADWRYQTHVKKHTDLPDPPIRLCSILMTPPPHYLARRIPLCSP